MSRHAGIESADLGYNNGNRKGDRHDSGSWRRGDYLGAFEGLKSQTVPDVFGQNNQQSIRQSVMNGNTVTRTPTSLMHPGQNNAPKAKADGEHMRSAAASGTVRTQDSMQAVQGGQAVLKDQGACLLKQAKTDHNIAAAALMDTARGMDMEAGAAGLLPSEPIGKPQAIGAIGADMVFAGMGSAVTAVMTAGPATVELSKHEKMNLSEAQIETLLTETLRNLQNPSPAAQDRQQGAVASAAESLVSSADGPDFSQFTVDDLREFLATRPEDMQEIQDIQAEEQRFAEVERNLNSDKVADLDLDGGNVALAGDGLTGVFGIQVNGSDCFNAAGTVPALASEFDVKAFAANYDHAPRASA